MPLVGFQEALENVIPILEKFREDKLPVIYIQHIAARPEAGFFLPETPGAEIHPEIVPQSKDKIVIKHYPNSFRETELDDYLKQSGITELVICGMMTHMCVDATTRAAKDFGYDCTVIGDACATKDMEIFGEKVKASDVHKSFLAALNYFYADVITTEQYLLNN